MNQRMSAAANLKIGFAFDRIGDGLQNLNDMS
jgi:hypothetical protein